MPGDVLCRCCVRLGRIVAGEGPPGLLVLPALPFARANIVCGVPGAAGGF